MLYRRSLQALLGHQRCSQMMLTFKFNHSITNRLNAARSMINLSRGLCTSTGSDPNNSKDSSPSITHINITFVEGENGPTRQVQGKLGESLLDIAHEHDIDIEGACGGELACSTCHCVFTSDVFEKLPAISEEEEDMLDLAWGLTDTSRLGCQIKATAELEGMVVTIPEENYDMS